MRITSGVTISRIIRRKKDESKSERNRRNLPRLGSGQQYGRRISGITD